MSTKLLMTDTGGVLTNPMLPTEEAFTEHRLNAQDWIGATSLPTSLHLDDPSFQALWDLHPEAHAEILIHGKQVPIPRWQQAYGADYAFSGALSRALPIPPTLQPMLTWCQTAFHPGLNGLLLNWYDGAQGHYIGKHRDSTKNMVLGAPIITISLGETRTFRLRPWGDTKSEGNKKYVDYQATDGSVYLIPYETNLRWTHEIPPTKKAVGKRISITIRAFETEVASASE